MPTSTETALELTAADACKEAAVELGAIGSNDELEDAEGERMLRRLNSMLQSWSVEGNIFREATATLIIAGGEGAVTLPGEVRDITSARLIVSDTNQRELHVWNRTQYFQLPNRATVGTPTTIYYRQGVEGDEVRIWPVPATDVTLHVDYSRRPFIVETPEDTLDVPQEWQEAVYLGLAARCASMFGADRVSPQTVARVEQRAEYLYQRLLDADRPDSYYFEPYGGRCC